MWQISRLRPRLFSRNIEKAVIHSIVRRVGGTGGPKTQSRKTSWAGLHRWASSSRNSRRITNRARQIDEGHWLIQGVDISVICEEVVESVSAGHVFQSITARSFDMVPDACGKMSDRRDFVSASDQPMGPGQVQHAGSQSFSIWISRIITSQPN
jgi:hypothetical protein